MLYSKIDSDWFSPVFLPSAVVRGHANIMMHAQCTMCVCVRALTQDSAMSAQHHPLSPDRRFHTQDLAVAYHVFVFSRNDGS